MSGSIIAFTKACRLLTPQAGTRITTTKNARAWSRLVIVTTAVSGCGVETRSARSITVSRTVRLFVNTHRPNSEFQYGIKTALKPDATVPIIWAILTRDALLLCTTHARRWLWRQYLLRELNTMRLTPDRKSLEVISVDIDVPDLLLPLPLDIASDWVDQFLAVLERLRTESDV